MRDNDLSPVLSFMTLCDNLNNAIKYSAPEQCWNKPKWSWTIVQEIPFIFTQNR